MPEVFWYPSIGNKGYPYTGWEWKRREYAWSTLVLLAEAYHQMYRVLRMRYKWSPDVVDSMSMDRLTRIYEETKIDFENGSPDEDDFE